MRATRSAWTPLAYSVMTSISRWVSCLTKSSSTSSARAQSMLPLGSPLSAALTASMSSSIGAVLLTIAMTPAAMASRIRLGSSPEV